MLKKGRQVKRNSNGKRKLAHRRHRRLQLASHRIGRRIDMGRLNRNEFRDESSRRRRHGHAQHPMSRGEIDIIKRRQPADERQAVGRHRPPAVPTIRESVRRAARADKARRRRAAIAIDRDSGCRHSRRTPSSSRCGSALANGVTATRCSSKIIGYRGQIAGRGIVSE